MIRLIARIDVRNMHHIKTIRCEGVQKIRLLSDSLRIFSSDKDEHDELLVIDTVASLYGRQNCLIRSDFDHLYLPIPLSIGGGIQHSNDAIATLKKGADKIVLNSSAIKSPDLISSLANTTGRQSVIIQIDTKKINGEYMCFTHGARELSSYNLSEWIGLATDYGAGELHITSIDSEGTTSSFPDELAELASSATEFPLIFSGGIRSAAQIHHLYTNFGVDSFSFSSWTNVDNVKVSTIRSNLRSLGLSVRLT